MRRTLLLVVSALAITAGCGSVFGGQSDAAIEETVTPVPITSERATTTAPPAIEYPPGISNYGVVDVQTLRSAHSRVLENTSFTLQWQGFLPNQSGPAVPLSRTTQVSRRGVVFSRTTAGTARWQVFWLSTWRYVRSYDDDTGTWNVSVSPRDSSARLARQTAVRTVRFVSEDPASVSVVERDGEQYVRLFETEPPPGFGRTVNYTATAFVTPDGLVKTVIVAYENPGTGQQRRLRLSYRDVGETDFEWPSWATDTDDRESTNHSEGEADEGTATVSATTADTTVATTVGNTTNETER